MIKSSQIVVAIVWIFFMLVIYTLFSFSQKGVKSHLSKKQIQNHAPVVKILFPKSNSSYPSNSAVPYEIRVSDKEDGESKYQEINPKEVFLEIKYANDTAKALELIEKNEQKSLTGLSVIKSSNCMNCHAFKSKLIGPSFYDIIQRYKPAAQTEDTLVNHILKGSKGRWGNVQMPSNDKLNSLDAIKAVKWLFANAGDSTVNYLAGTQGSFMLKAGSTSFKYVILVATYTDHGTKGQPAQKLKGEDVVIIDLQ